MFNAQPTQKEGRVGGGGGEGGDSRVFEMALEGKGGWGRTE